MSNPSPSPRETVFYSLLFCGLSSLLFDHPSTTSFPYFLPTVNERPPYLAVLAPCCQLFQFWSGVSSYAHFCCHSGKMSSHKFGTDGASLLGEEGGKISQELPNWEWKSHQPKNHEHVLIWLLTPFMLIIHRKKKKKKWETLLLPRLQNRIFRYQYCQMLETSRLKSNITFQIWFIGGFKLFGISYSVTWKYLMSHA